MIACAGFTGGSVGRYRWRRTERGDWLRNRRNGHRLNERSRWWTDRRSVTAGSIPPAPITVTEAAATELGARAQTIFLDQVTGAGQKTGFDHVATTETSGDYLAPVLRGILDLSF